MTVIVPWVGVLVAVLVSFMANFVWFGPKTFYPVWARALGKSPDDQPGAGQSMATVFGLTLLASLVMAFTISWVLQAAAALYTADVTVGFGALIGAVMGVGIAAAASLGHRLFAGQGLVVWAIEVGGDILGLTLMGVVLSFWF